MVNSYFTNTIPMNQLTPDQEGGFHNASNPSLPLASSTAIIAMLPESVAVPRMKSVI